MGKVTVFVLLSGMVLMVYGVFASLVGKTGSAVSAGVSSFADLQAEIVTNLEVQAANEKAAEAADALDEIDYGSLPLTQHALDGHAKEDWNAATIKSLFANKSCYPSNYICSADDLEVHYCKLTEDMLRGDLIKYVGMKVGLVIGHTVKQIVTGFVTSDDGYWESRCK